MKLLRYLANLGYGSRREVRQLIGAGRVSDIHGTVPGMDDMVDHAAIRVDGEPLDPPPGMVVMLNKPTGLTCSRDDAGPVIYSLFPERFLRRKPSFSSIGRLDKDTSGLLLLTDDGALLHRIITPRRHVSKVYEAMLADDVAADAGTLFASGTLRLRGDDQPLRPARLEVLAPKHVRLTISEGRYHQVRRMFAATGNRVTALHRTAIGALTLGDLAPGQWRLLKPMDVDAVFVEPELDDSQPMP